MIIFQVFRKVKNDQICREYVTAVRTQICIGSLKNLMQVSDVLYICPYGLLLSAERLWILNYNIRPAINTNIIFHVARQILISSEAMTSP